MKNVLRKSQNSGITLIALVVTIIVLLILAGVTVASLTGENGLMGRTTQARAATVLGEAKDECALVAAEETEKYYEDKYVKQVSEPGDLDERILTEIQTTESKSKIEKNGVELTVKDTSKEVVLAYTDNRLTSTETGTLDNGKITWESDTSTTAPGGGSSSGGSSVPKTDYQTLREGDTVYYKDASNNDIECTVLYDSQNTNYSTYGVQIIPRNPVTTVELGNRTGSTSTTRDSAKFATAKASYNNAINILNTAAQNYVAANSNLAAITLTEGSGYDLKYVARCVGSIPDKPSAKNSAMYSNSYSYFSSYNNQFEAGESDSTYTASNTKNYTVDWAQLENLNIKTITDKTNGSLYWLASRSAEAGNNNTAFCVHIVYSAGSVGLSGFVRCGL